MNRRDVMKMLGIGATTPFWKVEKASIASEGSDSAPVEIEDRLLSDSLASRVSEMMSPSRVALIKSEEATPRSREFQILLNKYGTDGILAAEADYPGYRDANRPTVEFTVAKDGMWPCNKHPVQFPQCKRPKGFFRLPAEGPMPKRVPISYSQTIVGWAILSMEAKPLLVGSLNCMLTVMPDVMPEFGIGALVITLD